MVELNATKRQLLLSLDITENEVGFYLYALHHPDSTAAEVGRGTRMDKSSAYRAAENLESKGLLISSPKNKGTTYKATSPEALGDIYREKMREFTSRQTSIDSLIDELKRESKTRNTTIKVEYGYEAHMNSMEDSIKDNHDKLILEKWNMENPIFKDKRYHKFIHDFAARRIKKGIRDEFLVNSDYGNEFSKLMQTSEQLLKQVRRVPSDADDTNSFRTYGDTTEVISFDENNDFIIVTISDKFVTDMIRKMFYFIWNRSEVI